MSKQVLEPPTAQEAFAQLWQEQLLEFGLEQQLNQLRGMSPLPSYVKKTEEPPKARPHSSSLEADKAGAR